jgi:hypothetical protein
MAGRAVRPSDHHRPVVISLNRGQFGLFSMIDRSDHRTIIATAVADTVRKQIAANDIDLSTECSH